MLPASGTPFEPTSTARLDEIMYELQQFAPHVRAAHSAALQQADSFDALAARLRAAMSIPLPRVWSPVEGSASQCEPKKPEHTHDFCSGRVGGGASVVDDAAAVAAAVETSHQLRSCVAAPLERWLDALDVASARLDSVERARLGLDAARREAEERFAQDEQRAHAAFAALRDPTAAAAAVAAMAPAVDQSSSSSSQYGRGIFGRHRHRGQHGLFGGGGGHHLGGLFSGHDNTTIPAHAAVAAIAPTVTPASAAVGTASARGALFIEQARAAEVEEASLRRAQLQRALAAVRASYEEQEGLAFAMLRGLAIDSARLKAYYAATLLAVMHGCQRLALALGPAKLPLPGYERGRGASGEEAAYGRIGGVEADVLSASPLAKELARGRLPPSELEAGAGVGGGAATRGAWPVVVRRAVATPMAVGADSELEARAAFGGGAATTTAAAAASPPAAATPAPLTAAATTTTSTPMTTTTAAATTTPASREASALLTMTTKRPAAAMMQQPALAEEQEEEFQSAREGVGSRRSSYASGMGGDAPAMAAIRAELA